MSPDFHCYRCPRTSQVAITTDPYDLLRYGRAAQPVTMICAAVSFTFAFAQRI
jgi:hypothetical protein